MQTTTETMRPMEEEDESASRGDSRSSPGVPRSKNKDLDGASSMSGGKRPSLTGGSPSDEDEGSDGTGSVDSTAALQKGKTSDEELEELLRERDPDVVVTSDQEVLEEVEGPLYE